MTKIFPYHSNLTKCGKISQTDPYVAVSVKLTHMCSYQSNTKCGKIIQTNQYVAISVKLTNIFPYHLNWNKCGKINQLTLMWQYQSNWLIYVHLRQTELHVTKTDRYICELDVSISVKLNNMWLNQSKWLLSNNISQT